MSSTNIPTYTTIFSTILRLVVKAAEDKRLLPYNEVMRLLGIKRNTIECYAGLVGDFCIHNELPLLNSIIVNVKKCLPSSEFDWYEDHAGMSVNECQRACFIHFHLSKRAPRDANFAELAILIKDTTDYWICRNKINKGYT